MRILNKIVKNISIIQIVICVLIFISMYIPIIHVKAGLIDKNYNTFIALTGIKEEQGKVYFDFSFLALLPYLFMLLIVIINIFLDNKKSFIMHIIKALLFLTSGIMVLNFKSLMNPALEYSKNLLKFVEYRPGRIITPIIMFIGFLSTVFEFLSDFNVLNKK